MRLRVFAFVVLTGVASGGIVMADPPLAPDCPTEDFCCGNRICDPEEYGVCAFDCGTCGNGRCDPYELAAGVCPGDCDPTCQPQGCAGRCGVVDDSAPRLSVHRAHPNAETASRTRAKLARPAPSTLRGRPLSRSLLLTSRSIRVSSSPPPAYFSHPHLSGTWEMVTIPKVRPIPMWGIRMPASTPWSLRQAKPVADGPKLLFLPWSALETLGVRTTDRP
jgi:hypothetical protein